MIDRQMTVLLLGIFALLASECVFSEDVIVRSREEFVRAVSGAKPGQTILVAPGEYRGGLHFSNVRGTSEQRITIAAQNPKKPPVFIGNGMQFSDPEYLTIRGIVIRGAPANGINIDDGGSIETPARGIILRDLQIYDVGPKGNRDGIKLSGVDDFLVTGCKVERWGSDGSGIDMVGCHRGRIEYSRFEHGDRVGGNAVQTKGGSSDILVLGCDFVHAGQRAVNIGGSTGMAYFRPKPQGYEAKNITVRGCRFIGSMAPVAFVGVDGAFVGQNTIYRPARWVLRILQETRAPEFVACRNGVFEDNIVVFRSNEVAAFVNVGPDTSPETFVFQHNLWYCLDNPKRSTPQLPVKEKNPIIGVDPQLTDPENGNLKLKPESPARELEVGADAVPAL